MATSFSDAISSMPLPDSPSGNDNSADISSDLKKSLASEKAERKAAYDPVIEKLNKNAEDIGNVKPAAPPVLQPYPEQKPTDPMEAWGSPAMWIATFGSLLTRAPLTSALNAAAGVNNAYAAKDSEAYKREVEKLKLYNDNAIKMADYEQKRYDNEVKGLKDKGEDYWKAGELLSRELGNSNAEAMMQLRIAGYHDKQAEHLRKLQEESVLQNNAHEDALEAEKKAIAEGKTKKEASDIYMDTFNSRLGELHNEKLGKTSAAEKGIVLDAANAEHDAWLKEHPEATAQEKANHRLEVLNKAETAEKSKTDQGIVNEVEKHYPGMTRKDLGSIPAKEQEKIQGHMQTMDNIQELADYTRLHPDAIGAYAKIIKSTNLDAYKTAEEKQEALSKAIDSSGIDVDTASSAKVLNKLITTQALNDAAGAGSRGATIYTDKIFREIYEQASSPETFFKILQERVKNSDEALGRYNLNYQNRNDKGKYPFVTGSEMEYLKPPAPMAHIKHLQEHPETAKDFDEKYGAGAAQYILEQK